MALPRVSDEPLTFDAIVSGAGIAGLAAALGLAKSGAQTLCIDAVAAGVAAERTDLRTAALFPPSVRFLSELGVWRRAAESAVAIRSIQIVEQEHKWARLNTAPSFSAREIGLEALAHNIPNRSLHSTLIEEATRESRLELVRPARIAALTRREDVAIVRLDDGRRMRAQLVVGADGSGSGVRLLAGIPARKRTHGRAALTFHVALTRDLAGVCIEIHSEGGVFTIIPLRDKRAAVVWLLPTTEAERLANLSTEALGECATRLAYSSVGPFQVERGVTKWPVRTMIAKRFTANRLALAGEAAHAMSPLGAQGLNLSLGDARLLARLSADAIGSGRDIGDERALRDYERKRRTAALTRMTAVETYAFISSRGQGPVAALRRVGLGAIGRAHRLRRLASRIASGSTPSLPWNVQQTGGN